MEGFIFDLKGFRSNYLNGMSQEDFAKLVGISQDKVSRMEADPSQVSLEILLKICEQFGFTLDELIQIPRTTVAPLDVEYTWSSAEFIRRSLLEYAKKDGISSSYRREIEELIGLIYKSLRKPKVAFIGRSDVGKSTMINGLLGSKRLPVHWTPATSIAIYIKHVNDRPSYMEDDVWIFRSDDKKQEPWDDSKLQDEAYCRSLKIAGGNYDLLNTYGTRKGEHFAESKATSAVVFIDSKVLLNCDFVDLPGYGTGDRLEDDSLSLREKSKADVLVYMSLANGFMRSEDISYLKEAISTLADLQDCDKAIAPLANLFIVASQAHVVDHGNQASLRDILVCGCERLERSLTEGFWEDRRKPEKLLDRFYTYTSNIFSLRERFENDLAKILETLPQIVELKARKLISEWSLEKTDELQSVITRYQRLLDDRKQCEETLKEYERNEPQRVAFFQRACQKVTDRIAKYKRESVSELTDYYHKTITVDQLVSLMEQRDVKKKKDDLQVFSTYVSGLLQDKTNYVIKNKSNKLSADIDDFLDSFERISSISVDSVAVKVYPFSKKQVFAAGLTGAATYGALALWAASCGNLGGYILIAKGVSLLSSLGISVGGTAAASSAIAAIGGPVVLGIALAVIAAIGAAAVFSGGWRKSVAKKIVASYSDARVLEKLQSNMNAFWSDTQNAFNLAADNLDAEWKGYVKDLGDQLANYDIDSITKARDEAQAMRNFIQNIPFLRDLIEN